MHRSIRQNVDITRPPLGSPLSINSHHQHHSSSSSHPIPTLPSTTKSSLPIEYLSHQHHQHHQPTTITTTKAFEENPINETNNNDNTSQTLTDYPQEVTWLFFRDNQWVPFQSDNHHKIEQAFTFGGIYVDIKDSNFPQLKSIRVFPTRFYLSYLGMKYRLSCVIQG
ncbi:hypothetical protein BJ944DRAFT_203299 [Cunninghamella echinulata]|nr:hypothetical protein BJ944DRAFT_203299 [Cunninghamella echinulata]